MHKSTAATYQLSRHGYNTMSEVVPCIRAGANSEMIGRQVSSKILTFPLCPQIDRNYLTTSSSLELSALFVAEACAVAAVAMP